MQRQKVLITRISLALQGRNSKNGDKWPPFHWEESSDLLRNPPWRGFTGVRSGRRHYEDGFTSMPSLEAAPAITPKVFSVTWCGACRPESVHVSVLGLAVTKSFALRTHVTEVADAFTATE